MAQGQARVPGLHVHEADPAADQAALERLGLWCLRRYSPLVALDPPDGLWLDATGVGHLFGDDRAMLEDLVLRLARSGIAARCAMAGTPGAAHGLARHGYQRITLADRQIHEALGVLPIEALRLPDEMVRSLRKLGFEQVGELCRTSRAALALRFGALLGERLDQMFGRLAEPLTPLAPPELVRVERAFVEPIGTAESLEHQLDLLVAALCTRLAARALGVRRLDLLCRRVDARTEAVRIGTGTPSQDPRHLLRLLALRLDGIDPGFGIERLALVATLVEPVRPQQTSSLVRDRQQEIVGLVDTLANRLGASRLYRTVPVESDLPERAVSRVAALAPPQAPTQAAGWPAILPRPARLLASPEPVDTLALLPDHPPSQFVWRGIRRQVVRADGPERVFGEWWRQDTERHSVRDYFQVEDQAGERFWLFRSGDGMDPASGPMRWYLHGLFA